MHVSRLMSFSIILCSLYGYCALPKTPSNDLPLVFVVQTQEGELKYPNQITKATIKDNGFTGDTQFSKDDNDNQIFFCAAESNKELDKIHQYNNLIHIESSTRIIKKYKKMTASENCSFNKKFTKEDLLQCDKDPVPVIYPLTEGKLEKGPVPGCGPYKQGVLYKFVYEVCTSLSRRTQIYGFFKAAVAFKPDVAKFVEKLPFVYNQKMVYKICYNHTTKETIYTKHKLSPSTLLFDERLKHERSKEYTMITDGYGHFNFSEVKSFYESLQLSKNPIEQNQSSNDKKSSMAETRDYFGIYSPEKLVPSDDFPTAVLRKPTFHYINVKPMHEGLVQLWNFISHLIRENFKEMTTNSKIEIYTGAFSLTSVIRNHDLPKNLPPNVPELWIKVIYQQNPGKLENPSLAIVMKNVLNFKPRGEEPYYDYSLGPLCEKNHCKSFKKNEKMLSEFLHLLDNIVCCPFNNNINKLFKILLHVNDTPLTIENLTDD